MDGCTTGSCPSFQRILGLAAGVCALAVAAMLLSTEPVRAAGPKKPKVPAEAKAHAILAGGCFWCIEGAFEDVDGVAEVISGYTGGTVENPSYSEVCSGTTGHFESVNIGYDPARISYAKLLDLFWKQIDPTDAGGQFADRGSQYRSAIFFATPEEKSTAEASKAALDAGGKFQKPIVTLILPAAHFFPAEEYHQDYSMKEPDHYHRYKVGSGREGFLSRTWSEEERTPPAPAAPPAAAPGAPGAKPMPSKDELSKLLTPMQFRVTQNCGTEPPFQNAYWNNHEDGIYVDVVSGDPLFSSADKFDSGTGWPSFTQPIDSAALETKSDHELGMERTEVRSKNANSHLGHVFDDGPGPGGKRFCINSASLRFVPKEKLQAEGYTSLLTRFGAKPAAPTH